MTKSDLTSIGDLTFLDIFLPSPDDGSVEPKHYNVDIFFSINLSFLDHLVCQFFSISSDSIPLFPST